MSCAINFYRLGSQQAVEILLGGRITPFSATTLRRKRHRNALAAGLTEWPQQGARHTYCSCWLAQHGDINDLVIQAGHEEDRRIVAFSA